MIRRQFQTFIAVLFVAAMALDSSQLAPSAVQSLSDPARDYNRQTESDVLTSGFADPPKSARPMTYWWWPDGNISKEGITADLEAFEAKGVSGVLVFDALGQWRDKFPVGKHGFMTPGWNEMFKHTVSEASRLGLTVSLNPVSGYCYGGAWAGSEDGAQRLFSVETKVKGTKRFEGNVFSQEGASRLKPGSAGRIAAVVAMPSLPPDSKAAEVRKWEIKAGKIDLHKGGWSLLKRETLEEDQNEPGEQAVAQDKVVNLSSLVDGSGNLVWDVPEGEWSILAFGHEWTGQGVHYPSKASRSGPHADYLDPKVTEKGVVAVVDTLLNLLSPESASAFHYIHEDSLEVRDFNWSSNLIEEFRSRRDYDPLPYLPVMAGRVVGSREMANRFLYDIRKTIGDMVADHHYGKLTDLAHARGLKTHLQAGGPHLLMMDPLKSLGRTDIPMGEFWVQSPHRPTDDSRFYVKLQSSAAHIYGKRRVLCEAFSAMGQLVWKDGPSDLKPIVDRAFCEGLNWICFQEGTVRTDLSQIPGTVMGNTPFTPTLTYWNQIDGWLSYLSRCSYLLQQGNFVADLLYYYGDQVPNQMSRKKLDPARGPGYDYDAINAEALLERVEVRDGRLVLPDGVSYRVLVLPDRRQMPLEVLQKIRDLVRAGAVVIGPPPVSDPGLKGYPVADLEVKRIATELWSGSTGQTEGIAFGKGRVFYPVAPKEVLARLGVQADFSFELATATPAKWPATEPHIDFIHRRDGKTEIYFVANRMGVSASANCRFRVTGKQPELWDPVSGRIGEAASFSQEGGMTLLPLDLPPHGSVFVVFRRELPAGVVEKRATPKAPEETIVELSGPWNVQFDPKWGPFKSADDGRRAGEYLFEQLLDWTKHSDEAVKYYSGTATYRKEFQLPAAKAGASVWLDLGPEVRNVAEVRLNGKRAGVLWCTPWRLEVSGLLQEGNNHLEIDVANLWTNRLIGDSRLPETERFTRTNGRTSGPGRPPFGTYTPETPLFSSGLLGPITLKHQSVPASQFQPMDDHAKNN